MSFSPSASDSRVNTKSESQKVPLSSFNVQQTSTGTRNVGWLSKLLRMEHWRQVVFSSTANRCTSDFNVRGTWKMCTDSFFFYSIHCLVAGFVYSRWRSLVTDGVCVNTCAHFKHLWAPGGAVNTLQDLTPRNVSLCQSVQTLVCCLREPCGKVQSHTQWPQCSNNRLTRTFSEDAG